MTDQSTMRQLEVDDEAALWARGVKILPSRSRSRSAGRWDSDSMKTLPPSEAKAVTLSPRVTKQPLQQQQQQQSPQTSDSTQWFESSKVLEDRYVGARTPTINVPTELIEKWYGGRKTLENAKVPNRQAQQPLPTWHTENLKVLPSEEQAPPKMIPRTPEYWHSGLYKTLPEKKGRAAPHVVWQSIPKESVAPYQGNWTQENFKVLPDAERRPKGGSIRDTLAPETILWVGGFKVLPPASPAAATPGSGRSWGVENQKVVVDDERRKRERRKMVVENTGWDSGLYKSIGAEPPKTYVINDDWFVTARKSIPSEGKSAKLKAKSTTSTTTATTSASSLPNGTSTIAESWRSGLKTVPVEPPKHPRPSSAKSQEGLPQYWHVENRKTLPSYYTTSSAKKEYRRYVLERRRKDMEQFHSKYAYHSEVY